jgi:hypothetical protein
MKIRKLGNVIFFAATLVVFLAGTVFTAMHRWNTEEAAISKANILAIAAGCFLTVGEIAFVFVHGLLDARELWRRVAAYVLSLLLVATITYAACTEANAFMVEGNIATKQEAITKLSNDQKQAATTRFEKSAAIYGAQKTLKQVLDESVKPDFFPFALNFFIGLFTIVTGTLIQPREPWRRAGNVMTPRIQKAVEKKIGFLPENAKAYYDGKSSSIKVQDGRTYLTTVSKKDIEE